jgi:phosphatidylinositol alpha-mannosyltransferase
MKIALVSPYDFSRPGGVVTHINALSKEFRARGHDVRIIAPCSVDEAPSPPYLIKATGSVQAVPYGGAVAPISLSPRIYRRVKRILRQEQFDVIHLHEPLSPVLPLIVLRHIGVSPKSLVVGTFHAYQEASLCLWQAVLPAVHQSPQGSHCRFRSGEGFCGPLFSGRIRHHPQWHRSAAF